MPTNSNNIAEWDDSNVSNKFTSQETNSEEKLENTEVWTLIEALEKLYKNKLNQNLNEVINLQTENDNKNILNTERNLVHDTYTNDDSTAFSALKDAILSLHDDDSSADRYLRKSIDSDSTESNTEERDKKSLEKFHDEDYKNQSKFARGRPISCWRGRKLCRAACREAARDFCYKYNFRRCSYRTKCRRSCRMWF